MTREVALRLSREEAEKLRIILQEWMDFNRDIPPEDDPSLPGKIEAASGILGRLTASEP